MENYCQNCRQPNPPDAVFCRQCASPLTPGASRQQGGANYNPNANQQWNPQNQGAGNFAQSATGKASGRAVTAMVLTGCGLCCGFFTGIPAAILGWMEINDIKAGKSSPKGMMMAQIGLWGGIAVSILNLILTVLWMFLSFAGR